MKHTIVYMGKYPMAKGAEPSPIPWIVYARKGDELYLISQDILDRKQYAETENNAWDESLLRKWLSTEFLNAAFNEEEQARLLPAYKDDKVSLLGLGDYDEYFWKKTGMGRAKYTDYVKSQLTYDPGVYGFYWTREANQGLTPQELASKTIHATNATYVWHVTNRGIPNGYMRAGDVDGVRPIIRIKKG
ncbi:MAG: DUF6273 domain-containing protein [Bacilli bacterium]|nr:DUF6273 domain-containing protein [Bacilli bacterium]